MSWKTPPLSLPPLTPNSIHIWRANLDHYSDPPILSPDEKTRAEQFKFAIHQNRFTAARTILRRILSRYLNQTPDSVQFAYTSYGKPYLPGTPLYFNLSHANQWALYAISLEEKTGIDIEHMREDREIEMIAERFFSSYENQLLSQMPADKKQEAFFRIWTCKEAFIKGIGEGLSFPLKNFDVSIGEDSARLVSINQDEEEAQQWSCVALNPAKDYVATLAVRASIKELKLWGL